RARRFARSAVPPALSHLWADPSGSAQRHVWLSWTRTARDANLATSRAATQERLPVMKHPFEQAVTDHGAVVLRVCRATLGPADADDAWSETFLAALRASPDLPDAAHG